MNLEKLPANLPRPEDDGACRHLTGMKLPKIRLASTSGGTVDLSEMRPQRVVVYCYPRTGRPGQALPGGWNDIPGARGCTPQACSFRDHYGDMLHAGAELYGLSTQSTTYQQELVQRLHLPYPILSDAALEFTKAMRLPTFRTGDDVLIRRLTLVIKNQLVEKVFYPVFPPDTHFAEVLGWLATQK